MVESGAGVRPIQRENTATTQGEHGNRGMESELSSMENNASENGVKNLFGTSIAWQNSIGNEGCESVDGDDDNKRGGDAKSTEVNKGEEAKGERRDSSDDDDEQRSTDPTEEITDSEGEEVGYGDDEGDEEAETRYEVPLRVDLNATEWNPKV